MAGRSRDKPADSFPRNPWPLLAATAVFTAGLGWAMAGRWRRGCLVMAAGMVLGALLRLVLPATMAGLLVVRRRWIDVLVLASLGGIIAALAWIVPPGHS